MQDIDTLQKPKCSVCGAEVLPFEMFYTITMNYSMAGTTESDIKVYDMMPLSCLCQMCGDTKAKVC